MPDTTYTTATDTRGRPVFIRSTDNAIIPPDPANQDYQAYLAWVSAGNIPAAAPAPSPPAVILRQ